MILDDVTIELAKRLPSISGEHRNNAEFRQLVATLGKLSEQERQELSDALGKIKGLLQQPTVFQPVLFDEPLKIAVSGIQEAREVQQALFAVGCGFFNGKYPLVREVEVGHGWLTGMHVSRTGAIGLSFGDRSGWFDQSSDKEAKADMVSAAADLKALRHALGMAQQVG
jgi:hypothetical protein